MIEVTVDSEAAELPSLKQLGWPARSGAKGGGS
jgi:hypothetical protein